MTNLDELKGLKVRAPTRIGTKFLTAIGAVPVQMPVPQVTESLSKGVIDGAMVPWEVAPALKLQEVTKYHVDTAAGVPRMSNSIFVIAMNEAKYDSLPADLKKVIDANTRPRLVEADRQGVRRHDGARQEARAWTAAASSTRCRRPSTTAGSRQTEGVNKEWFAEVGAKGGNGEALLNDAKALIKKYGG